MVILINVCGLFRHLQNFRLNMSRRRTSRRSFWKPNRLRMSRCSCRNCLKTNFSHKKMMNFCMKKMTSCLNFCKSCRPHSCCLKTCSCSRRMRSCRTTRFHLYMMFLKTVKLLTACILDCLPSALMKPACCLQTLSRKSCMLPTTGGQLNLKPSLPPSLQHLNS